MHPTIEAPGRVARRGVSPMAAPPTQNVCATCDNLSGGETPWKVALGGRFLAGRLAYRYDTPAVAALTHVVGYAVGPRGARRASADLVIVPGDVGAGGGTCLAARLGSSETPWEGTQAGSVARARAAPPSRGLHWNPPIVETVRLSAVLAEADLSGFERFVIAALAREDRFASDVLLPGARGAPPVSVRTTMRADLFRGLIDAGYLAARDPRGPFRVSCALFAVGRPDGRLRLIWDGRPLNALCAPPPRVHLPDIREELPALFHPRAQGFVAIDFQSWFVQLAPSRAIASQFFTATGQDGVVHRVTGVPMGFTWAPVVAHAVSCWIARRILAGAARERIEILGARAYIDNIIFVVSDLAATGPLLACIKAVARVTGAVIKPSSVETGPEVDWRGLTLSLQTRQVRLKSAFVTKVDQALSGIEAARGRGPLVELVALSSCILYAVYVHGIPFARAATALRWLANVSAAITAPVPSVTWESVQTAPREVVSQWRLLWSGLAQPFSVQERRGVLSGRAVGVSDAALTVGKPTTRAWAFHSPAGMRLCVSRARGPLIAAEELVAMTEGLEELQTARPSAERWSVTWLGDNMCAIQGILRSWSAHPELNGLIARVWRIQPMCDLRLAYQPSRSIIMDALTRGDPPGASLDAAPMCASAPPCPSHPGEYCPEFVSFITGFAPPGSLEGRTAPRALTYQMMRHRDRRLFHAEQPACAMARRQYLASPEDDIVPLHEVS